jgi:elongator complex protein 5
MHKAVLVSHQNLGKLLIFDNINALNASVNVNLPGLLSSFIAPTASLIAVYHVDVSPTSNDVKTFNAYSPSPITLLKYLATTIITVHSLHHILAAKAARDRSYMEPSHGLEEGLDGIVQGMGANNTDGIVLELEYRRRSGRGVRAWYVLPLGTSKQEFGILDSGISKEQIFLLDDHPAYRNNDESSGLGPSNDDQSDVTFDLGLTQKQRADREGVVLPYFDAQKGGGEGGRILYDMGEDDDFDEEEDEI